jgi:hypothetical protein
VTHLQHDLVQQQKLGILLDTCKSLFWICWVAVISFCNFDRQTGKSWRIAQKIKSKMELATILGRVEKISFLP